MITISIAGFLGLVNILAFFAFWFDKRAAMAREWRLPEAQLLLLALLGGSPGTWIASHLFRHKTKKQPFRAMLIAISAAQLMLTIVATLWVAGIITTATA